MSTHGTAWPTQALAEDERPNVDPPIGPAPTRTELLCPVCRTQGSSPGELEEKRP